MLAKPEPGRYVPAMSLCYVESPVGRLALEAEGDALTVRPLGECRRTAQQRTRPSPRRCCARRRASSTATLVASSSASTCRSTCRGTDHQKRVWKMMQEIPYGGSATYGGMAVALGSGPRAVGTACGRNPIPIIVPCHRVLGSGGSEGGLLGRSRASDQASTPGAGRRRPRLRSSDEPATESVCAC